MKADRLTPVGVDVDKKANTQDQSAALMYLPSESRSKIVAANQICSAMNTAKNSAGAQLAWLPLTNVVPSSCGPQ
jgi:hypothetical protein